MTSDELNETQVEPEDGFRNDMLREIAFQLARIYELLAKKGRDE